MQTKMQILLSNYLKHKNQIDKGSNNIHPNNYQCFYMILGGLMTKFDNFKKIQGVLQKAWILVNDGHFPENLFYQWVDQLYQSPQRIEQFIDFLGFVKDQQENHLNIIEEIQKLFEGYQKYQYQGNKKQQDNVLKKAQQTNIQGQVQRSNSFDTIPFFSQNNQTEIMQLQKQQQKHKQKLVASKPIQKVMALQQQDNYKYQERQRLSFQPFEYYDIQMLKKMQDDEQMARKFQQQQYNYVRNIKKQNNKYQEQTLCQICYVDLYDGDIAILDHCGHLFHKNCLIQNNFPLKCPNESCKIQALQSDIKQTLPKQLYQNYQSNTLKAYAQLHGDSVSWCPTANCGYMFFFEKTDAQRFQCLECRKQYCLSCRCQWHKDMTCKQYKISSTLSEDDKKFMDFVRGSKFKQCPKCKFWVQKNQGCDHMTCKCKFQFCYKCGGVFMKCECVQKQRQTMLARRRDLQQNRQKRELYKKNKAEKLAIKNQERLQKQKNKQKDKQQKQHQKASVMTRRARNAKSKKQQDRI